MACYIVSYGGNEFNIFMITTTKAIVDWNHAKETEMNAVPIERLFWFASLVSVFLALSFFFSFFSSVFVYHFIFRDAFQIFYSCHPLFSPFFFFSSSSSWAFNRHPSHVCHRICNDFKIFIIWLEPPRIKDAVYKMIEVDRREEKKCTTNTIKYYVYCLHF